MPKSKRVLKSKEELLKEMVGNAAFIAKMHFVREKIYPAVINIGDSVDETKMFLSSINNVLMEKFLGEMKKMTFKDLQIIGGLDEKGEKFDKYRELLALFDEMSVFDAKDYLEGMRSEIDTWINDEMRDKPMKDLKAKWIDQL
jgi:hypothetical protein